MPADMKQMIAEALTKLLEHKRVDKITVKELVDACGISRQTFYYHFQDIMDVIEWLADRALQRAVAVSLAASTPQEAVKAVILALEENEDLIQHLMASQRREEMERLLVQNTRAYLANMLRAKATGSGRSVSAADLEAAIDFCSYGLVGMMLEHLGRAKDADLWADQLFRLLTGEIFSAPQPGQPGACAL